MDFSIYNFWIVFNFKLTLYVCILGIFYLFLDILKFLNDLIIFSIC